MSEGKYWLAIDYGHYEGWSLKEYSTALEAFEAVKNGETYSNPWKILKEITFEVKGDE